MWVDEYQDIHDAIVRGDYATALEILEELDEMSRKGEVRRIKSFMHVLLVHLIKRAAKGESTRSWERSIRNAVQGILDSNKRDRSGGWYLKDAELRDALAGAWEDALDHATTEALGEEHDPAELAALVDRGAILAAALERIKTRS